MAKTSLYKISEQCRVITDKRVSIQVLLEAVKNAYAAVAKKQFYDNTTFDSTELNGSFIYTFPKVVPEFDCDRDMWYLTITSSYLELPHQMGVNWVSLMQERESWVLVTNWGIFRNLLSSGMGGRNVYEIEGKRMWFPKMTSLNTGPVLLKLAIALDTVDPEEELNIAPNMVNDIITIVTQPYMVKDNPIEKVREIIN